MQQNVYVFVHPAYVDMICYPQTQLIWDTFQSCGADVRYGDAFNSVSPRPGDQVVFYGNHESYMHVASRFVPEARWLYVVDESNTTSEPYDKALDAMKKKDVKNIIVTYQNSAHLNKLTENGVRYVIMPQTMPAIRPKVNKKQVVLISGQMCNAFYPTRALVAHALHKQLPQYVQQLETPGQDISTKRHDTIREKYYSLLDTCTMGVVCRAGNRDRFVAKYIEMGACNVLPIGDCPSYMPEEMKRAMLNAEGMSPEQIVSEVQHLFLAPNELQSRIDSYVAGIKQHYLTLPNMQRVMSEITSTV